MASNPRVAGFLLLAFLASVARAQWPSDPATNLPIVVKSGDQVVEKLAVRPDGSGYVAWFDNASGNYDVFLQRFNATGVAQWASGGLLVSHHAQDTSLVDWDLIADSQGDAVLAFTDLRAGGDLDAYAYRIDASGQFLWGPDGVVLSNNADFEANPRVAEASDGDFVFVWSKLPNVGDGAQLMQRLSPAGALRFAAGGIPVVTEAGKQPGFSEIVASDNGSVIVSYVRDIKTFASVRNVRAVKIDSTGAPAWPAPVSVFDAGSVPIAYEPKLLADGAGGALVLWHRAAPTLFSSFVQHLGASGSELWAHNGVEVSTTPNMHHIDPSFAFRAASGETFVFWNERNSIQSQHGIYGQKLSSAGARQWTDGGVVLLPVDGIEKILPQCVGYSDGAMEFHLQGIPGQPTKYTALGFRLDGAGNEVWAGAPLSVSTVVSNKSRLTPKSGAGGEVRLVWEDDRNGDRDLYGQSVLPDGTLGVPGLELYGGGTPGCDGPSKLTANVVPTVGQTAFALAADHAPPSSLGACIVADAQDVAGSDPVGLGVIFHFDVFTSTLLLALDMPTSADGKGSTPVPIPAVPSFAGAHVYAQTIWAWGGACVLPPFGLASTNGLAITIQP